MAEVEHSFCREMLETILGENYNKQTVVEQTDISRSTLRRILMNKNIELSHNHFKRLLSLYCSVISARKQE